MKIAMLLASLSLFAALAGCNDQTESDAQKQAKRYDGYAEAMLAQQAAARAESAKKAEQNK